MHDPKGPLVKTTDPNAQDKPVRFATARRWTTWAWDHLGLITVIVLLVVGAATTGYFVGATPAASTPYPPTSHNVDAMPHTTTPPRACGAPPPLNPGTDVPEPTETLPPRPTEPCVSPDPDIIVVIGAGKAKALPAAVGGVDCEMDDGYGPDYSACDPRPAKDVESLAKKLLAPEQLAFVNDHVVSTEDAYWAFDVKDTATLRNQYMVPGASYDASSNTITVYVW